MTSACERMPTIIIFCVILCQYTSISCKHGDKYPRGPYYQMDSNSDPGVQTHSGGAFGIPWKQDVRDIMYDFVPNNYLGGSNFNNFQRFHNGVPFPMFGPLKLSSYPFNTMFPGSHKFIQKKIKDETPFAGRSITLRKDDGFGTTNNNQRKKRSSNDVGMSGNGNIENKPEAKLAFEGSSDIDTINALMSLNAHSLPTRRANSRENLKHVLKSASTNLNDETLRRRLDDIKKRMNKHEKIQSTSHSNHNSNTYFKSGFNNKLFSNKEPAWTSSAFSEAGYPSPAASHHALQQGHYPHFLNHHNPRDYSFVILQPGTLQGDAPTIENILAVSPSSEAFNLEIPLPEEFPPETSHTDLIQPEASQSSVYEEEVTPSHSSIHQISPIGISNIGKSHSGFPEIRKNKHGVSGFGAHTSELLLAPESYEFLNSPNGMNSNFIPLCQQWQSKRHISNIPQSISQWIPYVGNTGLSNPQMMHLKK